MNIRRMLMLAIDRYKEKCDDNYEVLELVRDIRKELERTPDYDKEYDYYSTHRFLSETADDLEKEVYGGTSY